MLHAASDMFQPNHDILPVLDAIHAKGIPMGILSNTCDAHWQWIIDQHYPQLAYPFSPIVLSYEQKVMKPNREIYRLSTEKTPFAPSDIFFTDDRVDNIEAAKAFGWNTHLFTDAASLLKVVIEQWN
jgi:putative hydrolase of the HAD superfamily